MLGNLPLFGLVVVFPELLFPELLFPELLFPELLFPALFESSSVSELSGVSGSTGTSGVSSTLTTLIVLWVPVVVNCLSFPSITLTSDNTVALSLASDLAFNVIVTSVKASAFASDKLIVNVEPSTA